MKLGSVLQYIPRVVTYEPPSLEILPPLIDVLADVHRGVNVVKLALTGGAVIKTISFP